LLDESIGGRNLMDNKMGFLIVCIILGAIAFSGCNDNGSDDPAPELRVLVVNSYHEDWRYVEKDMTEGIVEGLSRAGYTEDRDYELKTFWMDTKITHITPEQIEQRAAIVFDLIDDYKPDVVFVNDDNALKYVAVDYTNNNPGKDLPFVFSGINLDPTIYEPIGSLENPGGPITGSLERFPYYDAFSLGKRILPNASKILLLADPSHSSDLIVGNFEERYQDKVVDSPLEVLGYIQVETFDEWKENVTEYQTKADFIGILNYHQLSDKNGEIVPISEVVDWMIINNDLPEIGLIPSNAEDGFLAVAGVSYYRTGIYAGLIGGDILGGSDPASIPIIDPNVVDTAFNLARAETLGMKIPRMELVNATAVYHSIGSTK